MIATQYEGSIIEDTGLIKMDFLGLKTLSIIKEALANIKLTTGKDVDIDHIPLDDPATFKLYCEGNTTATFQFESPGMQESLRNLQPSKFEDLIAMNALYRPGPMSYIPSFIARKHGDEPITYDIPIMSKYLEETYGITVYQEQVMLLSRLLASFTRGESDVLRKAMGKKQIDKMAKLKIKFLKQGTANGHSEEALNKIWADWEKFASYAFNKSHATCYSWVAYQTAYLKANYPAEYMAGVLSRNLTATDKLRKYMDECKRMGMSVKVPDINESQKSFAVNSHGEIRFGLAAIKGVGANAAHSIIHEREKNGPFKDIYDFVERVNLSNCNRSAIECLALAGAFDCFGIPREIFVQPVMDTTFSDVLVKYGQMIQNDKNSLQASLFGDLEPIETNKPAFPEYEPWPNIRILEEEKRVVTIYLSGEPLDPYYMEIKYGCNTTCEDYKASLKDGAKIAVGGLITKIENKLTKKGNPFLVITLEDFSGKAEISLFGKQYDSWKDSFTIGEPVIIHLSVKAAKYNPDFKDITIEHVTNVENVKGKIANVITLFININDTNPILYKELQALDSTKRPGQLIIEAIDPDTNQRLTMRSRKKFPVSRELVTLLEDNGVKFKITDAEL